MVDYHLMDNRDPYIYKTTDFGSSWTKISDGLPRGIRSPTRSRLPRTRIASGMLFAGTGNGFHYSLDDGKSWTPFKTGLPAAPVTWIEVQKRAHDVVRLDLRPRALHPARHHARWSTTIGRPTSASFLYAPRNGVREARSGSADFIYSLPEGVTGQVQLEILDAVGEDDTHLERAISRRTEPCVVGSPV